MKLREAEGLRLRRDRDSDTLKRDLDARMDSDRHEIGQLRTSLEIAKSEIRQLRAERAILTGQLGVARGDRAMAAGLAEERLDEVPMPAAHYSPLIDISGKSLRSSSESAGPMSDDFLGLRSGDQVRIPPAE